MRRTRNLALVAVAIAVSGCMLGPNYQRPPIAVPEDFVQPAPAGASIANVPWWDVFQDQELKALIHEALTGNKDLGIATARIEQARAQLGFTRADQYPFVDGEAGAFYGQPSRDFLPGADERADFFLSATVSFEVDLWGKLRRSTEAARAELLATEWAERAVVISLVGDVTRTYVELLSLDAQLAIARRTAESRARSLTLARQRFEGGVVPELDVQQAEILETTALASVSTFERRLVLVENVLNLLLGRNPGPIERGAGITDQAAAPEVPAGLPSELLQRRPDVLAAEQLLAAQTARIGVAEALRWPSLGLTATGGFESDDLDDLLESNASLWNIGANLLAPIFNSGKNKRRVEVERARAVEAQLAYEKAVQQAFSEVEVALVTVRTTREERRVLDRQVTAATGAARLSRARYDGGVTSYLEVLDSERTMFDSELLATQALAAEYQSVVLLYRTLGGGWVPEASEPEAQSAAP